MNGLKKLLYGFCMTYLLAVLLFPVSAFAEQSTTLTATVPSSHSVRLVIGENGTVTVNGTEYEGDQTIQVERLAEQSYLIQAEDGWRIESVTYGQDGQAAEVTLTDSVFTAPALNQDGNVLTVTIEEDPDWTGSETETETEPETEEESEDGSESETETETGTGSTGNGSQKGSGSGSVKTGDETPVGLSVMAGLLSLAVAAGCLVTLRRRTK